MCMHEVASVLSLFDPMDCSPSDSSVHGILQTRILEWVAMPSSRGSSQPQGSNRSLLHPLHWRWVLYFEYHLGNPMSHDSSLKPSVS